jgi:hypothetical protein
MSPYNPLNSRATTIVKQRGQNQVLLDYYKCPEEFGKLELNGQLSEEEGFFQFGAGTLCYGRCQAVRVASDPGGLLFDARDAVEIKQGVARLPFDLTEIVDNLRTERYTAVADVSNSSRIFNAVKHDIYYSLRPWMPVSVRRYLQRAYLKGWNRLRFPQWPVDRTVDTILEDSLILCMRAKHISSVPFIWFWPKGVQSCAMMTHDVETRAGLLSCRELMALDNSFEISSSFQFVPEDRYLVSGQFLEEVRGNGFEVNVQDLNHDGDLFKDPEEFQRRADRINEYLRLFGAKGFRSAIMYRNAEWLDAIEASYDMSFPNVAHLEPQRGGCCTVMPYFIGGIVELPLTTIQDYSLLHILGESSIDIWKQQIELIRERNGLISFIVHPDYLTGEREIELYKSLLTHLRQLRAENKLWSALPGEIDEWWRARNQMELVLQNGKWRIEGDGSEWARIAYANLANDRITYAFQANC